MRRPAVLLTGLGALAAIVGAAGAAAGANATSPARLQPFRSCGELIAYAKANASKFVGAGGVVERPGIVTPPAAPGRERAGADSSTTNVQEAGVDEPDVVKSDGSRIFTIAGGKLYSVDGRAQMPRVLGSLRLPDGWAHELLLHKGKLLVLSRAAAAGDPAVGASRIAPQLPAKTILSEVDIRTPSAMRVVRTLTVDGAYLTARQNDATARVVVVSGPKLPPVKGSPADVVAATRAGSWLPSSVLHDRATGRKTTRSLVQCRQVQRPERFSGVGLVTVVTIDLERGLPPVDSDAVMTDGQTVYASPEALYVASQRWLPMPFVRTGSVPTTTTEIHKLDTSKPGRTAYRASGSVRGYLLNQWSLSEHRGYLRVASTELPIWWGPAPQQESESFVTTLAERDGKLGEVGRVGGLGRGERVYAVRFLGEVGYVVTFRQVDPLYTIDLGDPARPRVRGALKILGYSAYLHPVGGDRLLGVGQDASEQGRVLGAQLQLFDVADLSRPARLDAVQLGAGSSEVEYDHHAFLFWPATGLAVVPVQISAEASPGMPFVGAVGFRIGRTGLTQLGRIAHPGAVQVRRSVVIGNRLYTVSEGGVKASAVATLADVAWVPFAQS
jgi:beta propeller domain-containing protein